MQEATSGLPLAVKLIHVVIKPELLPSLKAVSHLGLEEMGQSERKKGEWTSDSGFSYENLFRYQQQSNRSLLTLSFTHLFSSLTRYTFFYLMGKQLPLEEH